MPLQELPAVENGCLIGQAIQLQAGEVPHGLDLVQSVFHGRITEVVEQLHAVDSQHRGKRIGRPTVLALGVMTGYFLLQLLPGNQLAHPLQEDLATRLALLGLAQPNRTPTINARKKAQLDVLSWYFLLKFGLGFRVYNRVLGKAHSAAVIPHYRRTQPIFRSKKSVGSRSQ